MLTWESNVSSDVSVKKKRVRAFMDGVRRSLGPERCAEADARIAQKVCTHPAYAEAACVFTYLSVGLEVDTRAIIRDAWACGKTVAVPRCVPGTNLMDWYRIDSFDGLEKGAFGLEEPPADASRKVEVPTPGSALGALAIVPAYSFDYTNHRLGYGGGYYDVFLPQFGGVSMGLCREQQFSKDPLPCDEHDMPVDVVIVG